VRGGVLGKGGKGGKGGAGGKIKLLFLILFFKEKKKNKFILY
jgi:hypothetical protein